MENSISQDKDKAPYKKAILLKKNEYTEYFQSKKHELAFYFKVNNVIFDKYLGIKKIHMVDASKAKELQDYYFRMFHPDANIGSNTGLNYDEICADIKTTFHRVSSGKL